MEKLRDINPAHERFGYLSLVVAGAVVLAIGLLVRSDLFLSVVGFVLEILGWLGILGGACHSQLRESRPSVTSAAGGTGSSRPTAAPALRCRSRGDSQGPRSSCWRFSSSSCPG